MLATLSVALIMGMCVTPLVLVAREIIVIARSRVWVAPDDASAVPAPVEYVASRPVLPLG